MSQNMKAEAWRCPAAIEGSILQIRSRTLQKEFDRESYASLQKELTAPEYGDSGFRQYSSQGVYWWMKTIRQVPFDRFRELASEKVTVTMTTYPARMQYAVKAAASLFRQKWKTDQVFLWLAKEQFPELEGSLPEGMRALQKEQGLEIGWCEDLKPHKKYYYTFQRIRDGVIITVDDDLEYRDDTVEMLMLSYIRHPDCISAMRVHLMAIDGERGEVLPYRYWVKETSAQTDEPGMRLMATGAGGVLYPAGWFTDDLFDKKMIMETCLMADDLWLKYHEVLRGYPVVQACAERGLKVLPGSQENALWNTNINENDRAWQRITEAGKKNPETEDVINLLTGNPGTASGTLFEEYCRHADTKNEETTRRLREERKKAERLSGEIAKLREELQKAREEEARLRQELDRTPGALIRKAVKKILPGKESGEK